MKVCGFHLMPCPYLPEDFQQQYRSVWVDVPSDLYEPEKGHWVYNEYLDELEHADQMGFDGICVHEHHANAYGMMPSPNLMLAALIRRTSQAALIVRGNSDERRSSHGLVSLWQYTSGTHHAKYRALCATRPPRAAYHVARVEQPMVAAISDRQSANYTGFNTVHHRRKHDRGDKNCLGS